MLKLFQYPSKIIYPILNSYYFFKEHSTNLQKNKLPPPLK